MDDYHRSIYEHAHETLSDDEYEALAFATGFALFYMGNYGIPGKHPGATCRLGMILATGDRTFFKETYRMDLDVSVDMPYAANVLVEPILQKALEGYTNCAKTCRLRGVV